MTPMMPDDSNGKLAKLALALIEKSAKLSGTINPITRQAIADFLRPMNSYYSNLIEGHDTHPLDINKALNNDYSEDKDKRNLQLEAFAHITLHKTIAYRFTDNKSTNPFSNEFIKSIHKDFYDNAPPTFRIVKSTEGIEKTVNPGEFRTDEVKVGNHIAPAASAVNDFMSRFEETYSPNNENINNKIKRVIAIAASHHRLVWIHPFLDGNGRVVRLFSDACFMSENLHSSGLWSISRGLARFKNDYRTKLANADLERTNDFDGRGNLSNKYLEEFCEYFLKIAIDQIDFMTASIDVENMLTRIGRFAILLENKGIISSKAKDILIALFLRGKISKVDSMRITNTSDKTIKKIADKLIELGLLEARKDKTNTGITMMYYAKYPITFSPIFFPGLYPPDKEMDLLASF